jgi:hypothetical protein
MQTLILPARRGWRWLADGFALFKRNPPMLGMLVILYWLLLAFLGSLPLVGQALASVAMPALSVGVMGVCRALDRGETVDPLALFAGFRQRPRPLLLLGTIYLGATLAVLAVTALADSGILLRLMLGGGVQRAELDAPEVTAAAEIGLILITPVLMAFWFSPLLVAWQDFPPAKALFFSFFACWRNWRAFLAYGAAMLFWGIALPGILFGVIAALMPPGMNALVLLVSAPFLFIFLPTVFASFYVTYRDIFTAADHVDLHA